VKRWAAILSLAVAMSGVFMVAAQPASAACDLNNTRNIVKDDGIFHWRFRVKFDFCWKNGGSNRITSVDWQVSHDESAIWDWKGIDAQGYISSPWGDPVCRPTSTDPCNQPSFMVRGHFRSCAFIEPLCANHYPEMRFYIRDGCPNCFIYDPFQSQRPVMRMKH